jgi:type VI secretion system secreted protein Hcp
MPIYMKIPTIDGESQSEQFRDFFEVYSFSWGVSQSGTQAHGGGGGAGKVSVSDISFLKSTGKASPKLFLACCQGKHFPSSAVVVTRVVEGREEVYMEYKLENVLISSYQTSGDGGSVPTESLSLNFTKITYKHTSMNPDGSMQTETNFFDFSRNVGG